MRLKYILTPMIIIMMNVLLLTGCGSNEELETYKTNMEQFFDNAAYYDSALNSIDPYSDTVISQLFTLLDSMETTFAQMAQLPVPKEFPGVDQLADEASEYMSEAVRLYHEAYEAEPFNEAVHEAALENYTRANLRLQYIISILHGEIPEGIYTYEDMAEDASEPEPEE